MNKTKDELEAELAAAMREMAWALKSEDARKINSALDLARSEDNIHILPDQLDRDPWLFNCPNCTVDLRAGKGREHRRSDYITKLCPTEYHEGATCPTWEGLLESVFPATGNAAEQPGDVEVIGFLQRLFGYFLTGDVSEHILPVGWGVGANGKTTVFNTVMEVMGGDYAMKANAELIVVKKGERHPTEIAQLFGKRLVVVSESEKGAKLNESLIKDMTGGEKLRGRFMKQDFFEFPATHKTILQTNYKPRVSGTDEGVWRRLLLIPFTVTFWDPAKPENLAKKLPEHLKQDKQLPAKLRAEREGILVWMVRGCLEWQRDGLRVPPAVSAATREYRQQEDLIARFVEDRCLVSRSVRCKAGNLYVAYKAWCERSGEGAETQTSFGEIMARRFEKKVSNGVWYLGVTLREEGPDPGPDEV